MLKVEKKYLLLIAGVVWFIAGFNIVRIGIEASKFHWTFYMILLSIIVYILFEKMFLKMVNKHTERIIGYVNNKQNIFYFFNKQSYLIMAFMMSFGIGLRVSGICPDVFVAFFYTGLGAALITAGINFSLKYQRYNKSLIK